MAVPYLFALQDENYNFWKVDSSGGVSISADPYFLNFSPDGWNDVAISNIRNRRLWGIDRTVTIPLSYVEDGGKIIKHVAYKKGFSQQLYLSVAYQTIEYSQGVEYGRKYNRIFRGKVNIPDFIHNGSKVTVTTLEDGLPRFIKSNENTVYELPMNVSSAINVKMDGVKLHNTINYGVPGIEDKGGAFVGYKNIASVPTSLLNQEGDSSGLEFLSEAAEQISSDASGLFDLLAYVGTSNNWFVKNIGSIPVTFTLSGVRVFVCKTIADVATNEKISMFFMSSFGTRYDIVVDIVLTTDQLFALSYTFTITLAPGESLFNIRYFKRNDGDGEDSFTEIEYSENSFEKIVAITRRPYTFVKHFTAQYLWSQLVSKFTQNSYTAAISSFLAQNNNIVFTCGNAIRGFDDAVMKIKPSDFFKFFDSLTSVGLKQVGNTVDIDRKVNLIDTSNIIDLSSPAYGTFKMSVAKDYLFNEVEIGYPEIKSDIGALNGNEEYNCKWLFSIGTTDHPAKIEKISQIKASCYEMEKIRTTVIDKSTTDYKSDNDIFVNVINTTLQEATEDDPAHYLLDRSLNASVPTYPTGGLIEKDTVWNLAIRPKLMLLNNGDFIHSCTYGQDTLTLAYQTCEKNNKVVCNGITDKDSVNVGALDPQFFTPWIIEGDFPAPDNLLDLLNSNPLQVFRFTVDNTSYVGILNKVSIAHSSRKLQNYEFLSVPANQLQNLINFFG